MHFTENVLQLLHMKKQLLARADHKPPTACLASGFFLDADTILGVNFKSDVAFSFRVCVQRLTALANVKKGLHQHYFEQNDP